MFSSFDPDICMMLKHKQKLFPIWQLTMGEYKYQYLDYRVKNNYKALEWIKFMGYQALDTGAHNCLNDAKILNACEEQEVDLVLYGRAMFFFFKKTTFYY